MIGERPEVTDMVRSVKGEVVSSTLMSHLRHVQPGNGYRKGKAIS